MNNTTDEQLQALRDHGFGAGNDGGKVRHALVGVAPQHPAHELEPGIPCAGCEATEDVPYILACTGCDECTDAPMRDV